MSQVSCLRSRPHPACLALPGFFLFIVGILIFTLIPVIRHDPTAALFPLCVAMLFLVLAVPTLVWVLRHEIIADKQGIRVRLRREWRSYTWADVTDYYVEPPKGSTALQSPGYVNGDLRNPFAGAKCVVETSDGKRIEWGQDWMRWRALTDFVQAHANATETTSWQRRGMRTQDLPLVFAYDPAQLAKARRANLGLSIFVLGFFAVVATAGAFGCLHDHQPYLAGFIALGFGFLITMLGLEMARLIRAIRTAIGRIGESWTVHHQGFVFRDRTGEEFSVPWETVTGYDFHVMPASLIGDFKPIVVKVESGREFAFSHHLANSRLLAGIIKTRAVNGIERKIDYNQRNAMGGIEARWTGGVEGVGDRVFHARTKANSFWLFLPPLVAIGPIIELVLMHFDLTVATDPVPCVILLACCAVTEIAGFILLRFSRIIAGKDGLTVCLPCYRRSVAWGSMLKSADIPSTGTGTDITIDNERPLRIWTNSLAYGSELEALIQEHISENVQCLNPESVSYRSRIARP